MNWIVTIIIGGIIGWLASLLMKTDGQMGIIANVIVGIVGTSLGFWLSGVLGIAAPGDRSQPRVAHDFRSHQRGRHGRNRATDCRERQVAAP